MHELPQTGYLRLPQIIGDAQAGIPAIIPVSKSTWWAGVRSGRYPKPTKALGLRITAWDVTDILRLIKESAPGRDNECLVDAEKIARLRVKLGRRRK